MKDVFIFTICYNCGKILKKSLESFFKYHPEVKIHVFGTHKDFRELKEFNENLEFIELSTDETLKNLYKNGHLGTAYIWTKVLKKEYGNYEQIIHFDSDIIFKQECLSDIYNAFNEGYDLVGQRRSYENNKCNRNDLKGMPDVVGTCFFGLKLNKLSDYDFTTLHRMVVGYYNPFNQPILDFFDPVSFDVLNNDGKIKYLHFDDYGSTDENGSSENKFGELNTMFDFGEKIIHFAGVGSGMNFYINGNGQVPDSYANWAKERYALFVKLFYDEDLINIKYDEKIYNKIQEYLKNNEA